MTCEKDFKDTLEIFEGIINERIIKNAVAKTELTNQLQDKLLSEKPSKNLASNIKNALVGLIS